jgi:hypothetical protein
MPGWVSSYLIVGVGFVYLLIAFLEYFVNHKVGLALAFFGYALSNVGLYLESLK